jgi:spore coat protein CotH
LTVNFEGVSDPVFMAAEFDWNGVHFDSIGVRFKGNSSYFSYPGLKKSFKLDIDEYVDGQEIYGLDKLNLNNGFSDPTCVREKCCYELSEALGLPTVRTNYVALYINGDYWGLYTLVEQVDQEFIESRFGTDEEGNLWKGDPHGTLRYLGPSESNYYQEFELENNEDENDWSALVELADGLNNTPVQNLPDTISSLMDVNSALAMIALDIFTVNLDSYIGRCCNYYFYHKDRDDRMVFYEWDLNESWGMFNRWNLSIMQLKELDPFWINPEEERPLAGQLWEIEDYRSVYLGHMKQLMAGAAFPDSLVARMEFLRDMIRPHVYADPYKMFTNEDFDASLSSDVFIGFGPHVRMVPALEPFIRYRDSWLRGAIGEWERPEGLVLNELMADNEATVSDEQGDYDDWIEITNTGAEFLDLTGMVLSDNIGDPASHFVFQNLILGPGEYIIIWTDGEPEQGDMHAPFKLDADGEDIFLLDDGVIVDQVTYPDLGEDLSWGRLPDGSGQWQLLSQATPGDENQNPYNPEEIVLFLNEFMASNEQTIHDEAVEFEDWVEVYNPGPNPVDMGGLYLTDDLLNSTKWSFPDTTLNPGMYLLVWCDDDEEDGPLHASFKLSDSGEEVGLFGRISAGNELIDQYIFDQQQTDISNGRKPDGSEHWVFFSEPTPGTSNNNAMSADEPLSLIFSLDDPYPNPFSDLTTIRFTVPARDHIVLSAYDLAGRRIAVIARDLFNAGTYTLTWDGKTDSGRQIGTGTYLIRLESGDSSSARRIVILR